MKTMLVGGTVDGNKRSVIADMIAGGIGAQEVWNGMMPDSIQGKDLTVWMIDIDNKYEKEYPKKDKGSVLICSKVMREGYTDTDAVTRIFKMNGNAVIKIYTDCFPYKFQLTDALGNDWTPKTESIPDICDAIRKLYEWTKASIRKSLRHDPSNIPLTLDERFVPIVKAVAKKVMNGCETRFFGNYSTRCTKLFPSGRVAADGFLFSPRNVDKQFITQEDFVFCDEETYYGDRKPSVDTPVQIELYKAFPNLKYMIHGHAYVKDALWTKEYFPCGDMREVQGVIDVLPKDAGNQTTVVNLKNHGFIIMANSIFGLEIASKYCEFFIN